MKDQFAASQGLLLQSKKSFNSLAQDVSQLTKKWDVMNAREGDVSNGCHGYNFEKYDRKSLRKKRIVISLFSVLY